jgi:hypothetical protein
MATIPQVELPGRAGDGLPGMQDLAGNAGGLRQRRRHFTVFARFHSYAAGRDDLESERLPVTLAERRPGSLRQRLREEERWTSFQINREDTSTT